MVFIISACHKDEKIFIPDQTHLLNSSYLLSRISDAPLSYLLALKEGKTLFRGPKNTLIEIPYQSLRDSSGTIINGEIKLEFNEFAGEKRNLLSSPETINNEGLIDCSKIIYLKFTQQGKKLQFATPINVYLPAEKTDENTAKDLYESENATDWVLKTDLQTNYLAQDLVVNNEDSSVKIYGYKLVLDKAKSWYCVGSSLKNNINHFTSICLTANQNENSKNSLVYFISENNKSVIKLTSTLAGEPFCRKILSPVTPIIGHIVIISYFGGENYYFGMTNAVIGEDTMVNIKTVPTSIEKIKEALMML